MSIELQDLVIRYDDSGTTAVDGVTMHVDPGEVVALLGPNGAGKSTLLHAIEGYVVPNAGVVRVLGHDPATERHAIANRWGVMPQSGGLPMGVTVIEAIELFAGLHGAEERVSAILDATGLAALRTQRWRKLSGGEQQRLSLALALCGGTEVLLLDEPTNAVDAAGRERILELVADRAGDGAAVLITTHRFDDVERVADRVVILDHGIDVAHGTIDDLTRTEDRIEFRAPTGLPVQDLARQLAASATEGPPGHYRIDLAPSSRAVGHVNQWLADHGTMASSMLAGRRVARIGVPRTDRHRRERSVVSLDRIKALLVADLRIARRDGEQLLLTLGLPILLLVFFSSVDVLPTGNGEPVDFLAPGIIALAVLSVSFVRTAIGLGFDRSFGAIRRFAVTPLRASEFIVAKFAATLVFFAVQLAVLSVVALGLGWDPSFHLAAPAALVLGLILFSALGIVVASVVEGLTALALANTLYVVLLILSGLVFELDELPGWLQAVAKLLPSTALAELLRSGFAGDAGPGWAWVTMLAWAVGMPLMALRLFRWE